MPIASFVFLIGLTTFTLLGTMLYNTGGGVSAAAILWANALAMLLALIFAVVPACISGASLVISLESFVSLWCYFGFLPAMLALLGITCQSWWKADVAQFWVAAMCTLAFAASLALGICTVTHGFFSSLGLIYAGFGSIALALLSGNSPYGYENVLIILVAISWAAGILCAVWYHLNLLHENAARHA